MSVRQVVLLLDEMGQRNIDLLRALYDRALVDRVPPYVPLVAPFEENTPTRSLAEMIGLIVATHPPFMLEMATPQSRWAERTNLLELIGAQGSEAAQSLATSLYRDVFPHHHPPDPADSPLQRTALTVGRFSSESDAVRAAGELREKSYFLVISEVGILEQDTEEEGGWSVARRLTLGEMIEIDA